MLRKHDLRRPVGWLRPGAFVSAVLALTVAAASCRSAPEVWDPASGDPQPSRASLPVRGRAQARSLSCESRSACDLLGWFGIPVAEDDFFEGLARSDNPEEGFVGSVDDPGEGLPPQGYGVYERPLADRIRAFGLDVRGGRDRDLAWLRSEVAQGRPVIVWATARLDAPRPVALTDRLGRGFHAVRGEHTFLVVGYGPCEFELLDPGLGTHKRVPVGRFAAAWRALGQRSVGVASGPGSPPPGAAVPGGGCFAK